jgi:predicted membrane protein
MNTMGNIKNALFVVCSIILMAWGGLLLDSTLNRSYYNSSAVSVIAASLFSVFFFVAGVVLAGRCMHRKRPRQSYVELHDGTVPALLLIAAGVLLLRFNTGHLPHAWKNFFFSWQMLLFVIGIVNVCRRRLVSGIIMAAAGIFFFHSKMAGIYPDGTYESFISIFWPVLIIVLGILLFFAIVLKIKRPGRERGDGHWKGVRDANADADGKINYRFVFSGAEQVILDPVFRGGTIEATFGGMELDLRRTSLPEGDTFLHVKLTFGGMVITAPDSWDIEIHQKSFAGRVEDSRIKSGDGDKSRKLVIMAECTLGGIEIK